MKKNAKINEIGRSMVEMLGVLAIIGVLTVGGIAGYSQAMAKHKLNRSIEQIFSIITNVRLYYATKGGYSGLNNSEAIKLSIIPADMLPKGDKTEADGIRSVFGEPVNVKAVEGNEGHFSIEFQNIGGVTCISLMSSDWGTDGLVSIATGKFTAYAGELPVSAKTAAQNCLMVGNNIIWTFY